MKTTVLLKRVPDLVEDLEVDDTGKALDEDCVSLKLNEFDDHALEEALLLKESGDGGEVTVVALDGEEVDKMLYTALAKGADRAVKITGVPEGSSNLELARLFAGVVGDASCDLVLTGVQSAEDRDGQLGPMVAALLDLPSVEVVTGVTVEGSTATLHKEYAGGVTAEFEVDLPAVLGVQAARRTPRYAPVSKVRQVKESATLEVVERGDAGEPGSTIVVMTPPEFGEGAQMLESAQELFELLDAKGVIE